MVAELHRWSGGVKAMCLAASLRGDAQAILADLEAEKRRNYTNLVDAISSRFGPARQTELRRIQLRNRGRKKGETIPDLAQDVKRLTRFAYPGASSHLQDQLSRDHFVDCLEEPELRLGVHQTRPKTLEEAVQAALEIEAFYTVERQRNFPLRKTVRVLHSDQGMTNTLAGANVSVLSRTFLLEFPEEKQVNCTEVNNKMSLADGKSVPLHGLLEAGVNIDGNLVQHKFWVADIDVECILG
ncbi:hypothetical protein HOLleu_44135 [Holothuria leucospilota]|uniref:Uncharacterized protein n=1 Tax=Holothuria leucospilota TaxID=206669 RepID=A0A9Q0YCT8_HOLLE|nr:hypothetical protein HOLleu_44135 [Holothuria leucospilota]